MNRFVYGERAAGREVTVEGIVAARRRWKEERDAWLREHGLVMNGMSGLSWDEFRRIEREEPHRILRRP
ncbi:hypothetical protein ACFY2M_21615 [Streptomyces sp. NPDC001276]|uniref:hypothetical protein n=1 Tax=Streptomyces sp. NPDC001276 TaxID=3364555 RepID=UPI003695A576